MITVVTIAVVILYNSTPRALPTHGLFAGLLCSHENSKRGFHFLLLLLSLFFLLPRCPLTTSVSLRECAA